MRTPALQGRPTATVYSSPTDTRESAHLSGYLWAGLLDRTASACVLHIVQAVHTLVIMSTLLLIHLRDSKVKGNQKLPSSNIR